MLLMLAALAGCELPPGIGGEAHSVYQQERFLSDETFSRLFDASVQDTCEAARRALLSQGYLVNTASADTVAGRKYYQPHQDVHYEVQMRVVCAPEGQGDARTSAFASALQDRYMI